MVMLEGMIRKTWKFKVRHEVDEEGALQEKFRRTCLVTNSIITANQFLQYTMKDLVYVRHSTSYEA